ncbi:MAG: glycerol-3-phosphate 1-O-acyltransferase PlsY [Nitrosomonadales bacterium]
MLENIIYSILAYFVGSISFGILLSKLFNIPDPRTFGSKNPGATNVMRSGKKLAALCTLLGDTIKGFAVTYLAIRFNLSEVGILATSVTVFLGHLYPIYYKFKGGKGVATALGILLAVNVYLGLAVLLVWLVIFLRFRISSLSALVAALSAPIIYFYFFDNIYMQSLTIFLMAMLLFRHQQNIKNLLSGSESSFK